MAAGNGKGEEPFFISIKRAAKLVGVHDKTFRQWIADGIGPPVVYFQRKRKKSMRVRYQDLKDWVDNPSRPLYASQKKEYARV